jgi:hypothetical protein
LLKQKQVILCPTSNVEYQMLRVYTQTPGFSNDELLHADPFVLKTLFDLQDLDTSLFHSTKARWAGSKSIFRRDSVRLINLKKLVDGGIRIAAGTDVGSLGDMPGASYLPELLKMKQSGMSNWQIIKAATLNPTYFIDKENSLGSIVEGKIADMILLNKNPVADLNNVNDIALVFKNGNAIFPDTLINETSEMLVQRQWNAYNTKNVQAFLTCFDEDVKVYNYPASILYNGIKELERNYTPQLENSSKTHCELKSRIMSGDTVVDKVAIKEPGKIDNEQIIVYKVSNHKIKGIYLLK